MTAWLSVIGVGESGADSLTAEARAELERAEVWVGGARHLAMFDAAGRDTLTWRSPLRDTLADIEPLRGRRVAVLATGEPLWFGIGSTLARHFGREALRVLPAVGAFSLAAARLNWSLQDSLCRTLHGRPLEALAAWLHPGARLLLLTRDGAQPAEIAALCSAQGYPSARLSVLEHLGGAAERRQLDLPLAAVGDSYAALNVVALEVPASARPPLLGLSPGLPDDAFIHDGKLTKRSVRAATLARLRPLPGQCLWDLGAGCGSIAIEWLRASLLCGLPGTAVAVENRADRLALIRDNARALGVPQLQVVEADLRDELAALPRPQAIFIGGGLSVPGLIERCVEALPPGGRLVANAVTLQGERMLLDAQQAHGGELERLAVSAHSRVGGFATLRPMLPVLQFALHKDSAG